MPAKPQSSNPTPLQRLLISRRLSYEVAAELIREAYLKATGERLRLRGAYMGQIARGDFQPSLKVARAIVSWSGGALALADLVDLAIPGLGAAVASSSTDRR